MGIFDRIKSAISGATGNFIAISDAEKLFLTVVEFGKPYALAQVAKDLTRRVGYEFDVTTMNVADPKFQSILKAREDLLKAATKQSTERMVPSANQGMRDLQFASLFFYYLMIFVNVM